MYFFFFNNRKPSSRRHKSPTWSCYSALIQTSVYMITSTTLTFFPLKVKLVSRLFLWFFFVSLLFLKKFSLPLICQLGLMLWRRRRLQFQHLTVTPAGSDSARLYKWMRGRCMVTAQHSLGWISVTPWQVADLRLLVSLTPSFSQGQLRLTRTSCKTTNYSPCSVSSAEDRSFHVGTHFFEKHCSHIQVWFSVFDLKSPQI